MTRALWIGVLTLALAAPALADGPKVTIRRDSPTETTIVIRGAAPKERPAGRPPTPFREYDLARPATPPEPLPAAPPPDYSQTYEPGPNAGTGGGGGPASAPTTFAVSAPWWGFRPWPCPAPLVPASGAILVYPPPIVVRP